MSTNVLKLRGTPVIVPRRRSRIPLVVVAGGGTGLLLLAAVVGSFASSGIVAGGGCQAPNTGAGSSGSVGGGRMVIATTYGGPGDPTSSHTGAANPATGQAANLTGKMAWAELGATPSNSATFAQAHRLADLLAGSPPPQTVAGDAGHAKPLPYGLPLQITSPAGRSVVAYKLDIGAGAPGAAIDIWYDTALALNLPGAAAGGYKGPVRIAQAPPGSRPYPGTNTRSTAGGLAPGTAQGGQGCTGASGYPPVGAGIDPIPGFTIGRDDMGVDASAPAGTPIYAPLASQLVEIVPGWYLGQPLLLFKFLQPPAGALSGYWYVAEEIAPASTTIGATFRAHQPVARFAPSGTGIEIGWGSPSSNARTLAAVTDPAAANPPTGASTRWGESFKHYFHIP